jgi:hypothetical protein
MSVKNPLHVESEANSTLERSSESLSSKRKSHRDKVSSSTKSSKVNELSCLYVVLVSTVEIIVDETVLGRHHVEYFIEFQSLRTGQTKSVRRRYRQILKWYQEVSCTVLFAHVIRMRMIN